MQYKFRGKRIEDGLWIFGSLIAWPDGTTDIIHFDSDISGNKFKVMPETVGQFTHRLDNDLLSDIYQGDILQSPNGKMWEVVFKNHGWAISNKRIKDNGRNKFGGMEEYSFEKYIKIYKTSKVEPFKKIGNIHDNPELLNDARSIQGTHHMLHDPNVKQTEGAEGQEPVSTEATETQPETQDSEEGNTEG